MDSTTLLFEGSLQKIQLTTKSPIGVLYVSVLKRRIAAVPVLLIGY